MAQEATSNTQNDPTMTAEKSFEKLPPSADPADNNFVSSDADNFINKIRRSEKKALREKCPNKKLCLVRIFLYSD